MHPNTMMVGAYKAFKVKQPIWVVSGRKTWNKDDMLWPRITGKFLMKCYVVSKISGKQVYRARIWVFFGLKFCLKDGYAAVKIELIVCGQTRLRLEPVGPQHQHV